MAEYDLLIFMPLLQLLAAGGILYSGCLYKSVCMLASVITY